MSVFCVGACQEFVVGCKPDYCVGACLAIPWCLPGDYMVFDRQLSVVHASYCMVHDGLLLGCMTGYCMGHVGVLSGVHDGQLPGA